MKTLTLFGTFVELSEKHYMLKLHRDTAILPSNIARHRVDVIATRKKMDRCKALLTKRLQEQEEGDAELRIYVATHTEKGYGYECPECGGWIETIRKGENK